MSDIKTELELVDDGFSAVATGKFDFGRATFFLSIREFNGDASAADVQAAILRLYGALFDRAQELIKQQEENS